MAYTKSQDDPDKEIKKAEELIKLNGIYSHYKNPQNKYKVLSFAVQEATDKICVIYQPQYGKKLLFIRDLDNWLEQPIIDGKAVERFKFIDEG
ncbi:hypothetical protein BH09PAT1_BH09PAT1_7380 [soil metagenome]